MRRPLTFVALALCAANLAAEVASLHSLVFVFKPLATLALAVMALRATRITRYSRWIAFGLIASLAGDILLMLPAGLFVPGLVAFLVAHLCYITALAGDGAGLRAPRAPAFPVFALAIAILLFLWPSLGAMRVPVTAYVCVIATMAWQAIARWRVRGSTGAMWAAVGAVFFLISDASLATRRFVAPFTGATLVVMLTYYVAQWGLTLSVEDATIRE